MKRLLKADMQIEQEDIYITFFVEPILDDIIESAMFVEYDRNNYPIYHTDVNPDRIIDGPLSKFGDNLPKELADELETYTDDCLELITEMGFTIINSNVSKVSKKSQYAIIYGVGNTPCGSLVFDLRISEHPYDAKFPEDEKSKVLKHLKDNHIVDGTAVKENIDFKVVGSRIGISSTDTWDKSFRRLQRLLDSLRRKIRARLNTRQPKNAIALPLNSQMQDIIYDFGTIEELHHRHPDIPQDLFIEISDNKYSAELCITDDGTEYALSEFKITSGGMDVLTLGGEYIHIDATTIDADLGGIGITRDFNSDKYMLWQIK